MAELSFALLIVFLAGGCHAKATSAASRSSLAEPLEFDAGVIFADEANYLCIPFERLGLSSSAHIASVETSCECVRGSVVSYSAPNQTTAHAVRLDFVPEPSYPNAEFVPMLLAVQIAVKIEGIGSKREFSIDLIHSVDQADDTLF